MDIPSYFHTPYLSHNAAEDTSLLPSPKISLGVKSSPDLELPLKREQSGLCLSKEEKLPINDRKTLDKAFV